MKINAVIESRDGGTLVLDFPRSIYDVYEKLQSVGIRKSPHQIALCDEECDDVRVKLYSEDEVGKHLLLTLNEQNSLADANMLVFMVDNAKADFRSKLEQNLLHDQYTAGRCRTPSPTTRCRIGVTATVRTVTVPGQSSERLPIIITTTSSRTVRRMSSTVTASTV